MDGIISEIFEKYQVRKTKKQKTAFTSYAVKCAEQEGYSASIENGGGNVNNIVIGNPDKAKVIFTAHYDTCPKLPFPNLLTPQNLFIYILFNIAVVLGMFVVAFAIGIAVGVIFGLLDWSAEVGGLVAYILYFAFLILLIAGPANKHTANDNTSGVTVLFGIMKKIPKELRDKVAIVFFDGEEMGLLGSGAFSKAHKNVRENTLLINFDCVSDGEDMLIVVKKKAKNYKELLEQTFVSSDSVKVTVTDKAFYPSDQMKFKTGVGVAAFKKTKGGLLYIDKIHTAKDTVYRRENIDLLIDSSIKLSEKI